MVENLESRQLLSTTWFVSPSGSNTNSGAISAPFKTIQQAANVAQAGDHVEIRAGVYHETVTPAHSGTPGKPIVYEAYNGESVTISGADAVTGWADVKGAIYSASMPWDLGEGNNEVFVNGAEMNEAVWPNTGIGNVSHPNSATMTKVSVSGDSATIYNSGLSQPSGSWVGAVVHFNPGQSWDDQTGVVTASAPGHVTIKFWNRGGDYQPIAGNKFYIFGKYQALDSAGEWYRDPTSGKLYLWAPSSGNPNNLDVEAKHRQYAFNLNGVHDVTVKGVKLFAAAITTTGSSSDIVINGVTSTYGVQQTQIPWQWKLPATSAAVMLMGANDVLANSTVAFTAGMGVAVGGAGTLVKNNIIHDTITTGSNAGAVTVLASYVTVDHNTIYNSGRHGILASVSHATITYNSIHDVGLQTTEAGGIYTIASNGLGSVMAYNTVYNIHTGGYGGTALFPDNNSSGWSIHNNITYNVDYAFKLNFTSHNIQLYNNTLYASRMSINTNYKGNWSGVQIYNNIFGARTLITPGAKVYNNAYTKGTAGSLGAGSFTSGASGTVVVTQL